MYSCSRGANEEGDMGGTGRPHGCQRATLTMPVQSNAGAVDARFSNKSVYGSYAVPRQIVRRCTAPVTRGPTHAALVEYQRGDAMSRELGSEIARRPTAFGPGALQEDDSREGVPGRWNEQRPCQRHRPAREGDLMFLERRGGQGDGGGGKPPPARGPPAERRARKRVAGG